MAVSVEVEEAGGLMGADSDLSGGEEGGVGLPHCDGGQDGDQADAGLA